MTKFHRLSQAKKKLQRYLPNRIEIEQFNQNTQFEVQKAPRNENDSFGS